MQNRKRIRLPSWDPRYSKWKRSCFVVQALPTSRRILSRKCFLLNYVHNSAWHLRGPLKPKEALANPPSRFLRRLAQRFLSPERRRRRDGEGVSPRSKPGIRGRLQPGEKMRHSWDTEMTPPRCMEAGGMRGKSFILGAALINIRRCVNRFLCVRLWSLKQCRWNNYEIPYSYLLTLTPEEL